MKAPNNGLIPSMRKAGISTMPNFLTESSLFSSISSAGTVLDIIRMKLQPNIARPYKGTSIGQEGSKYIKKIPTLKGMNENTIVALLPNISDIVPDRT
jgi:hypothetical protein